MTYDRTDQGSAGESRKALPQVSDIICENKRAIDILARTIWGEARGEGCEGMQAVACVILNRLKVSESKNGYWWGDSIIDICQHPYQFSVWNKDDPNLEKMTKVSDNDTAFSSAKQIARRAIYGTFEDITCGATHYHAAGITPIWSHKEKPVETIGQHIFYRLDEG